MVFECWDSSGSGVSSTIQAANHAEAAASFVVRNRGRLGKAGLVFVVNNAAQDYQVFYADELEAALARTAANPPSESKPSKGFLRVVK